MNAGKYLKFMNIPKIVVCTYSKLFSRLHLKIYGVRCGKKPSLMGWPRIFNEGSIIIKDNVSIVSTGLFYSTSSDINKTVLTTYNTGKIIIGNNVTLNGTSIVAEKKVVIGDDVMIASNCKIIDTNIHPTSIKHRYSEDRKFIRKDDIIIEDNVWIGLDSIILKGVKIGMNSIVGAGSVVTKNVPKKVIVAGNPAKVIKKIE